MNRNTSITKRFIAFVVAFVMMVAMVPTSVFADYNGPKQADAKTDITNFIDGLSITIPASSMGSDVAKTAFVKSEVQKKLADEKINISDLATALKQLDQAAKAIDDAIKKSANAMEAFDTALVALQDILDGGGLDQLYLTRLSIKNANGSTTHTVIDSVTEVDMFTDLTATTVEFSELPAYDADASNAILFISRKIAEIKLDAASPVNQSTKDTLISGLEKISAEVTKVSASIKAAVTASSGLSGASGALANAWNLAMVQLETALVGKDFSRLDIDITDTYADAIGDAATATVYSQLDTLTSTDKGVGVKKVGTAYGEYSKYNTAIASAEVKDVKPTGAGAYDVYMYIKVGTNEQNFIVPITVTESALDDPYDRMDAVKAILQADAFTLTSVAAAGTDKGKSVLESKVALRIPGIYKQNNGYKVEIASFNIAGGVYTVALKSGGVTGQSFPLTVTILQGTPVDQMTAYKNVIDTLDITVPLTSQGDETEIIAYISANLVAARPANNSSEVAGITYMSGKDYHITLSNSGKTLNFIIQVEMAAISEIEQLTVAKNAILAAAPYEVPSSKSTPAAKEAHVQELVDKVMDGLNGNSAEATVRRIENEYFVQLETDKFEDEFKITVEELDPEQELAMAKAAIQAAEFEIPTTAQVSQSAKTAYIQTEVDAIIADTLSGGAMVALVMYTNGYFVQLSNVGKTEGPFEIEKITEAQNEEADAYLAAVGKVDALKEAEYTPASWASFMVFKPLFDLKLDVTTATAAEMKAETEKINAALSLLVKVQVEHEIIVTGLTINGKTEDDWAWVPAGEKVTLKVDATATSGKDLFAIWHVLEYEKIGTPEAFYSVHTVETPWADGTTFEYTPTTIGAPLGVIVFLFCDNGDGTFSETWSSLAVPALYATMYAY